MVDEQEIAREGLGDGIPRIDFPHVKLTLRNYIERLFMDQTDKVYEFLERAIDDGDTAGGELVLICRTDVARRNAHVFSRLLRSAFEIEESSQDYNLGGGYKLIIRDDDGEGELVEHEHIVLPCIVK